MRAATLRRPRLAMKRFGTAGKRLHTGSHFTMRHSSVKTRSSEDQSRRQTPIGYLKPIVDCRICAALPPYPRRAGEVKRLIFRSESYHALYSRRLIPESTNETAGRPITTTVQSRRHTAGGSGCVVWRDRRSCSVVAVFATRTTPPTRTRIPGAACSHSTEYVAATRTSVAAVWSDLRPAGAASRGGRAKGWSGS